MEDFKIIECTTERIIVNREPQNEDEIIKMRLAAQNAIIRDVIIRDATLRDVIIREFLNQ